MGGEGIIEIGGECYLPSQLNTLDPHCVYILNIG